jgi:predicted lipoprotein with Yx(FWY)xxD motif
VFDGVEDRAHEPDVTTIARSWIVNRASAVSALAVGFIGACAVIPADSATAAISARARTRTVLTSYSGSWGRQVVVKMKGQRLSLYVFSRDHGKSTCYGRCQKVWYPLHADGRIVVAVGSHISADEVGTVRRKNGSLQVTYYGQPLYRYYKDARTGQLHGRPGTAYTYGGPSGVWIQFGGFWNPIGTIGKPLACGAC